ncbi:hypothetical protein KFL_002010010 [Klebsormidium nitens]|uniref:Uncharacterized protein n=1 Tax=Klebsormidium nitens TaxID=105231 RepID=A0A0U9HT59_KLENI|nr:hypothetical protein KFL_002010010 [Klebsormidium nitens]|eukprot:GAQ84685.1 hypothetical protein KFL_002010010 [Klebsormidium nitens]
MERTCSLLRTRCVHQQERSSKPAIQRNHNASSAPQDLTAAEQKRDPILSMAAKLKAAPVSKPVVRSREDLESILSQAIEPISEELWAVMIEEGLAEEEQAQARAQVFEGHKTGQFEVVTVYPALVEAVKNIGRLAGPEKAAKVYGKFWGDDSKGDPQPIYTYEYQPEYEEEALRLLDGACRSDYRVVAAVCGLKLPTSGQKMFITADKRLVRALNKHAKQLHARLNLTILDPKDFVKLL